MQSKTRLVLAGSGLSSISAEGCKSTAVSTKQGGLCPCWWGHWEGRNRPCGIVCAENTLLSCSWKMCWKRCQLGAAHEDTNFLHWRRSSGTNEPRIPFSTSTAILMHLFHTTVVLPEENLRWQQHHSFCNRSWSSCDPSLCHQSLDLANEGPLYLTTLLANHQPIEGWKCSFLADLVMCSSHLEVLHHVVYICVNDA